jgi:hypothetical protein
MFRKIYKDLLNALLSELITCWQRQQPEKLLVESAFLISQKHCNVVKNYCWQHGFGDSNQEIYFFKHIHPQFAAKLIYYTIVYESLLSCPRDEADAAAFWLKEIERYRRFCEKNDEYIAYREELRTDEDDYYFLRKEQMITSPPKTFFMCCEDFTIWSAAAAGYIAEQQYKYFVEGKLLMGTQVVATC